MQRDCMSGEKAVKQAGTTYLPALDSSLSDGYDAYQARAKFVNMFSRTVGGLGGTEICAQH